MQKLISIIGGLLTLIAGYHLYLNVSYPEEYSFEHSIKLFSIAFRQKPITLTFLSISFLTVGSIVSITINKIWTYVTEKHLMEKRKIQTNLERTKKITEIRNQFFSKVFLKFDSPKDYPLNPMHRIKGDFNEVNLKDINDNKFPLSDYMSKYETFDFTEDGIEVLGGDNIIGFTLLIDENDNWDVLDRFDKPKKGKYRKAKHAYSVHFLSYEDILFIDWDKDPYEGNITISCHFRYKNYNKHPFKEFRYYIDVGALGYRQLEPDNRKSFSRFDLTKPFKIYYSRIRNHISRRRLKSPKYLWR